MTHRHQKRMPQMVMIPVVCACLLIGLRPAFSAGEELTLAQKLCAEYGRLDSVSCEILKTTSADGKSIKWLSRVFYQKGDRIHVENVAPAKRRIIADGKVLYYYAEGDRRGYSKPIPELPAEWLASLHNVPGTPMEHLLKLKDIPETVLEGTTDLPVRRGYQAPKVFVVLSCDKDGKLTRIEFYSAADMQKKTAEYEYAFFQKITETCWIPCLHKAVLYLPSGDRAEETRRINNLEINKPIAPALFEHLPFFKDIEFTDEFEKTYSE
jgi:hypothetical protein